MPRLIAVTLLLAVLYAGYWVLGQRQTLADMDRMAEDLRLAGWQVDWAGRSLRGFPSRLDLTVEEPALVAPDGSAWTAPFVQSLQLTYRRNRAILAFAERQTVTLAGREIAVTDRGLRASIVGPAITAEADEITLTEGGRRLTAGPLLAAVRPDPGAPGALQLYLRAEAARLDGQPLGTLLIEGRARLSDRQPPRLLALEITRAEAADLAALPSALAPYAEALLP